MKKSINYVTLDKPSLRWLKSVIIANTATTDTLKELFKGIEELSGDTPTALFLEAEGQSISLQEHDIVCGDLAIYPGRRKVLRNDTDVSLTPKEFDILYFLAQNKGIIFTKEQIYQAVWEEDYLLADSNIMAFIRKLRKKIEPNPDDPEYIITIWGIGYKFSDQDH